MITVNRVGDDYQEIWLEEGERELAKRLFKIKWDSVIIIVTIIRKGIDSEDLHAKLTEDKARDENEGADLFACADPDHI